MPCINSRIIVNPHYINSTHIYRRLEGFSKLFYVSRGVFDFKYFSPKRRKISLSDLDSYIAIDPRTGDSIPVYMSVPCGKCDACRLSKRFSLRNRMILEQYGRNTPMFFVTLTYDDAHLPLDGVSVRDCQLFFKRFRERLKTKFNYVTPFRYILFSEYGKLRGRPHYHFVLFGFDYSSIFNTCLEFNSFLSSDCWQNGFTRVDPCDSGAFNYVSKYVLKKSNVPCGKCPNFILSSRSNGGIGCNCLCSPSIIEQISDCSSVIKLNCFGKYFEFPIPKQVLHYCYKNNVQYLRRKYLPHVRRYFTASSALSNLYSSLTESPSDFLLRSKLDEWNIFFNDLFGMSLLDPQSVSTIAPYAPEFYFFANDSSSNLVTASDLDYFVDMAITSMFYLQSFDVSEYPSYLENTNFLYKFASQVHLTLLEKYGNRVDFSDDAPVYSSKLSRANVDFCRDFQ